MEIFELQHPHTLHQDDLPDTVMAVGYFDGVHRGHQEVIRTAKQIADETGRTSAVMTFHPHPSVVLKKETQHVQYITPLEDKIKVLEDLGIDRVYLVTFNKDLAGLLPQEFVNHYFIGLNVSHVVAGFDFSYGKMGKGTMETLPAHGGDALSQTVVSKVTDHNKKISSTLIRQSIREGNIDLANELLGRPYRVRGTVITGDQRGRTIGFPTANLDVSEEYLLPKVGVYAVKVEHRGSSYFGMANIGYKPTFQDTKVLSVEINLFDYEGDLYGDQLEVEWHAFIRDEVKFNGVDHLIHQLQKDEAEIRNFFA
ncbi:MULTISPECIES: bifunctional riboflavin kinase/FAD synthetase [Pontibacillus]|uniref:Riboflavin biosynthesis protein n=1 Tax=Pontibacillus chungwhensis TaxID=265426 RepID=A0ABY8V237_9BACI|nr:MULTISPECIES: bifunctional riboflavin kinase/FAD synthetase [Pontibacillus]MCD5322730.1 bifunctional riboflavin kinase/FAD synthetase [Pontibacillus sp. HN14]WIG00006.1 bifunctional riboflavin kinase/FAD synthetase [Pontibacillus chungwhensis]